MGQETPVIKPADLLQRRVHEDVERAAPAQPLLGPLPRQFQVASRIGMGRPRGRPGSDQPGERGRQPVGVGVEVGFVGHHAIVPHRGVRLLST